MKPIEYYDKLKVTIGWSGYPQITEGDGKILYSKKLDFLFYKECYLLNELNEYPINPYTKEKLEIYNEKQMNTNQKNYNLLFVGLIIAFFALLIFTSCGAKTVNKEQTKTDSTAVATQIIKTDSTSTDSTSIKFDVVSEEIIIEAVDSTKPIEITNAQGKVTKYKNARLSHRKRKDNTIVVNEKSVSKIVVDSVTNEIEVNKIESSKVVYKEQFNWGTFILQLWWLWLLIILACYLAYRRYKGYLKFPLL